VTLTKVCCSRTLKEEGGRSAKKKVSFKQILDWMRIDDWNIFWANPWSVKQTFNPDTGIRLNENQ
jgi:hypothetical protein